MDLQQHLESHETFADQVGRRYDAPAGLDARARETSLGAPSRARAVALLSRIGALPRLVEPTAARGGIPVGGPRLRFRSIEESKLEDFLCKLPSIDALLKVLEEGAEVGAFNVVGDRVNVTAPDESDPRAVATFDITSVVERAGMAIKAREAAPLLQKLEAGLGGRESGAADGRPSGLVRLRGAEGQAAPVLREGPEENVSGIRKQVRELFRRHPVLASAGDLGADAVFMIAGEPIRMLDGRYVPVEAIQEEARAGLLERLQGRDAARRRPVAYVRMDEVEPVSVPEPFRDLPLADAEVGTSPARIELAYRLVKGLALNPESAEPIEATLRSRLETMLGSSFGHVKLHTGPAAQWIAESLEARAVTHGEHVFIPEQRLREESHRGQPTLAHELTHVRQNEQGAGSRSRADLEAEASRVERAAETGPALRVPSFIPPTPSAMPAPTPGRPLIEGVFLAEDAGPGAGGGGGAGSESRKIELRSEETLQELERQFQEQRAREKEAMRDRVF